MTKQQNNHANEDRTINEGNMTSIDESELEGLSLEENCIETDYKLGKDGKRRRISEDLRRSPNRCSPKLPKPDNGAMDDDNNPALNLLQLEEECKEKKEILAQFNDEYG
jgi:hypothetical protein